MIVEFIGCTGAGKSTLIAAVRQRLAQRATVTSAFEVVATPLGLQGISHPSVRNLVQEGLSLPSFLRVLPRHYRLVLFALRMLARQGQISLFTCNNLRSLVRKVGVDAILRRTDGERIVLVDEGTVLLPHNLFVYTAAHYSAAEIAQLGKLLPLPDVIVYVQAPVETLLVRSLQRPTPPRELKGQTPAQIEEYLRRAVAMFDHLVTLEPISRRLLTVENLQATAGVPTVVAEQIVDFILRRSPVSLPDQALLGAGTPGLVLK